MFLTANLGGSSEEIGERFILEQLEQNGIVMPEKYPEPVYSEKITSIPIPEEDKYRWQQEERRRNMTEAERWLKDNGYPQFFLPLLTDYDEQPDSRPTLNSRPGSETFEFNGTSAGIQRRPAYRQLFDRNYKRLPDDNPVKKMWEGYQKRMHELMLKEGLIREYSGFWNESGRNFIGGLLELGTAGFMQIADVSEGALWTPQDMEKIAGWFYEKSRKPAFQPGVNGGVKRFVANVIGRGLPSAGAVALAGYFGGGIGALGTTYSIRNQRRKISVLENGGTEAEAEMAGFVCGVIGIAFKQLSDIKIIRLPGSGKGSIKAMVDAAYEGAWPKVLSAGGELTYDMLENTLNKAIYDTISEAAQMGAIEIISPENMTMEEFEKKLKESFYGGAIKEILFGGLKSSSGKNTETDLGL